MRRAIMPVLLLLLVSVQAFAGMCCVRCAIMSGADTQNSIPAMTNCRGMSNHAATDGTSAALLAAPGCSREICQSDLSLLQNHTNQEIGALQLSDIMTVLVSIPATLFQNTSHLRFHANRSTQLIPPFNPLISHLRI
jgi:hypothetical protein